MRKKASESVRTDRTPKCNYKEEMMPALAEHFRLEEGNLIRIVDITPDNWRLDLKVAESQKAYVANSVVLLARAYAYRNQNSCAFIIYHDETPVGMGLYYDCPESNSYDFRQIFIDQRFQGCGYGKAAIKLVLDDMKKEGKYGKVAMCYIEGNDVARKLYEQFGFVEIGRDGDEIIMEMSLHMDLHESAKEP